MADRLLSSDDAWRTVTYLRKHPSERLVALRSTLRRQIAGKSCLVLGSAPSATLPADGDYSRCLCVNGSPVVAKRNRIEVDVTVVVGFTTSMKKDISALTMEKLRGHHSDTVVFVSAGDTFEKGLAGLQRQRFSFHEALEVTAIERAVIVGGVCGQEFGLGRRDERVSNGVFTIVLALWAGASRVLVSGISLSGGHDYASGTPRYHVEGDRLCLQELAKKRRDVITTSCDLAKETGLPFYGLSHAGWWDWIMRYLRKIRSPWSTER